MGIESIFEMGVVIKAVDMFTGPMRKMALGMVEAQKSIGSVTNTMKMMGKSRAEIDAITSSLNRMGDKKAFSNVARDLQAIGTSRADIAAMETSYMRMAQYQRDMALAQERYAAGKDLAMSGVGNLTTAAMGGFGIFELVKKAGEFQSNMAVIQSSTGASTKQMQEFGDAVMNTSAKVSKFNDMQVSQIAQKLTSGGFSNIKQAQSLLLPVSKYAEVQMYEHKSSDPLQSTQQAIEMAHIFKNYDPKSFESFLNTFNKYSMMQPGDSTQLEQTLKYLAPTAQTMGMKSSDILSLSAVANRIGLSGSHGGTNAADMILRLIPGLVGGAPTKKKTPKAWRAMEDLGFIDKKGNSQFFDKKGKVININGMLTTMINDSKKMNPMQLQQKYHDIFGIQGGRAASILANPKTLEQLTQMKTQFGKTSSMEKTNAKLQGTSEGQLNLLKSNSMTLMLRVGQQLAISLNPAIASVNKLLGSMLKFSEAHPQVAKLIGDFALFAVGGKMVEGVVKILAGNFKMLSATVKMSNLSRHIREGTKFGKILSGFGKFLKPLGSGLLSVLKVIGRFGLGLVKLGIQAAAWAIRMAASWLIAMGPVGWIIAGVTAVISLGVIAWMKNFFGFRDKMTALWGWLKNNWKTLALAAINPIGTIVTLILSHLPGKAGVWGRNMIKMFSDGIMSGIHWVENSVGKVANKIKGFLGFHSPTKEGPMRESDVFMPNMMKMFASGIDGNAHLLQRSAQKAALTLRNSFASGNSSNISLNGGNSPVEIHIHPHPNQRAEEIADIVMRKLGKSTRGIALNTGASVNMGAM
jgi:TP901 family phage tail tape measure protein